MGKGYSFERGGKRGTPP